MSTFKTWVDHWVETYNESPVGRTHAVTAPRFPDDSRQRNPVALQYAAEGDGAHRSFAHFWHRHRERPELGGQSLAMLHSLTGAEERTFRGYLVIRSDLEDAEYLAVPEVRLAWRFLTALGEALEAGDRVLTGTDRGASWSVLRRLDLDFATIELTSRDLFERLYATDMIDPHSEQLLTPRARHLVTDGSLGEFYRAFVIRSINRCPWRMHDGLAEASLVQIHALFLLYLIHRAGDGLSAQELVERLAGIARVLSIRRCPAYLPPEKSAAAAVVLQRFLGGFGRRFGLLKPAQDPIPGSDPFAVSYVETAFAARVLHWQTA